MNLDKEVNSDNPRIQCNKCGHWNRLYGQKAGVYHQYVWPVGVDQDWCQQCCDKPENKVEFERLQKESGAL